MRFVVCKLICVQLTLHECLSVYNENMSEKKLTSIQEIQRAVLIAIAHKILKISMADVSAIFSKKITRQGVYRLVTKGLLENVDVKQLIKY